MDNNEENEVNDSGEIIDQENTEKSTPKDNEGEDPEESQRELEKDLKLIEGENDETPEQREERLQKEREELLNLRFYKVAQQLVYRFIRENSEIIHSEGKLNMKFEVALYISTVLETIATKLIQSAVTIPNWDPKDDKLTVIRAQVAIRKFTDLAQLFSNPVLKYTSLKYLENNTIMKLKQMKLFQSQDSEMLATMNRKKGKDNSNKDENNNNNNGNRIKEYLGNGVIIAKISNKYFPTYVVNSDFVTFTSNILNEVFNMIVRRISQCIKFTINDNIMEKIIASLIPSSIVTEIQTAYNNVIDVFTLRSLPETQQFYFIYLDGLTVKRKLKSQCDRYQSILVAVTALFEELGVIRMKHFQSDEEKNREIKQLKSRWILLYNGIPISFNDTLNELGVTGFNNSIFVMEKRIYDEKRKKDVQKGYITFNDNVSKEDQKYVSEYQYQYEVAEQKTEEAVPNPVESSASIALSPSKPTGNGSPNGKNAIVMINGNYYNRKGRVLKPTNELKYLSDDQIKYYEDKFNAVAKPTLLNLHRYIDYLNELVENFEDISNNLSVDNTTTNPSELATINNNVLLTRDITMNNVTNAIQAYENLFKAYQNRREYKQKMFQSNPANAVKEDDIVIEQNEEPAVEEENNEEEAGEENKEEEDEEEGEEGEVEEEEKEKVENEEEKEDVKEEENGEENGEGEEVKTEENNEENNNEEVEEEGEKKEENEVEEEGEKEEVKEEEEEEKKEEEENDNENNHKEDEIIDPEPVPAEGKEENNEETQ